MQLTAFYSYLHIFWPVLLKTFSFSTLLKRSKTNIFDMRENKKWKARCHTKTTFSTFQHVETLSNKTTSSTCAYTHFRPVLLKTFPNSKNVNVFKQNYIYFDLCFWKRSHFRHCQSKSYIHLFQCFCYYVWTHENWWMKTTTSHKQESTRKCWKNVVFATSFKNVWNMSVRSQHGLRFSAIYQKCSFVWLSHSTYASVSSVVEI